jgi:hypothetical protein
MRIGVFHKYRISRNSRRISINGEASVIAHHGKGRKTGALRP